MNRRAERFWFFLMAGPAIAGFLLFQAGPMAESARLSFTRYDVATPPEFVGFRNYIYLLAHDPAFWPSVKVTALYALASVPLGLLMSLGAALLVKGTRRWRAFFRTLYFLPALLPAAASSAVWVFIFHPEHGVLNRVLASAGIDGPAWTQSETWALPALVLMGTWGFGGAMLVFLAGLDGISREIYEAAEIDGAGRWGRFWHVTLPALGPVLFFNFAMALIGALKVFDAAFVFGVAGGTGLGGPARATLFFGLNLYVKAFVYFHMGLASAMAWMLVAATAALTWLGYVALRRWTAAAGEN